MNWLCVRITFIAALCFVWQNAAVLHAQAAPELPANPGQWVNAPPLSNASLAGKGVVLWYYEEGCPSCRAKWPALVELSKKYEGEPVVFIAVNSGNSRQEVEQYARQTRVPWPIIVDSTREFEKQSGVGEISLRNIYQVRYIDAAGKFQPGSVADMDETVKRALAGAAWKVDPAGMPTSLRAAWQAVELGNYAVAVPVVKKALNDRQEAVKVAAARLDTFLQDELQKEIDGLAASSDKWTNYKTMLSIVERYKGLELPADFKTKGSELHADAEVKKQLDALKAFEGLKKGLTSGSPIVRKKTADKLDDFITQHAGTEAAEQAAAIKEQLGGT